MISKISSSNWVVFKGALKRLKWLGILYGVALFLELPLQLWMELSRQKFSQGSLWAEVANKTYLSQSLFHPIVNFVNIVVSIIFGLLLFYYLQNDRASTFYHSLPIKRASLYWQNLLAGLTLIWVPVIINGLLLRGVYAYFGVREGWWLYPNIYTSPMEVVNGNGPAIVNVWQLVAYWLFLNLLMTGLLYVFTIFIGMFTGNILLQGALTLIGLFLPLGLYLLIRYNLWRLLYGYPRDINNRQVEWLSPVVRYLTEQDNRLLFQGLSHYFWYFGCLILLCLASIYLYKARPAEAAGETLAAPWIRWVFKYGVAICAALAGGLYFSSLDENSISMLYIGYLIGAGLGYIIADMIAYKSFHFYKRWKGMLVFGAVFILIIFSVKLDLYGYERYVPAVDDIKEVSISSLNRDGNNAAGLTSQENIDRVRQLHQEIIKKEKENRLLEHSSYYSQKAISMGKAGEPLRLMMAMDITYTLNNGSKIKRTYNIDISRYRQFLYPIFNSREAKLVMFRQLYQLNESKIDQINLNNYHLGKNVRIYKPTEIKRALAALKKDVLNISYEAALEGKAPALASIEFVPKDAREKREPTFNLNYYAEFSNFEQLLGQLGYLDELFIEPKDVSEIIIKRTGREESYLIKDKQKIKTLLNWCNLEDERSYLMRQQQPENKQVVEYFGKVIRTGVNPLYIGFDVSPQAQQIIYEAINSK